SRTRSPRGGRCSRSRSRSSGRTWPSILRGGLRRLGTARRILSVSGLRPPGGALGLVAAFPTIPARADDLRARREGRELDRRLLASVIREVERAVKDVDAPYFPLAVGKRELA